MAIIGKIRQRSTLVLIIIGGAIMAFVLTDLFSAKAGGAQQGPIYLAEVEGEKISPVEFDVKLQQAFENYEAQSQQPMDETTKSRIRENVFNQMLSEIIIGNEMEELGLTVTSKELFDMVQGNDPHPQVRQVFTNPETGQFSSTAVVQFLQNLDNDPKTKEQWVSFERALKANHKVDKYNTLVESGLYIPSTLAEKQYKDNNSSISFKYVYKSFNSLNDSTVTLTEEETKSYYEKNKDQFEQPSSLRVYYAYLPIVPSALDIERARTWTEEAYKRMEESTNDSIFVNANSDLPFDPNYYSIENMPLGTDSSLWSQEIGYMKGPYMIENTFYIQKVKDIKFAPDSVKARHILINAQDRTAERAEAIADSLIALLNGGADFEILSSENSDDVTAAQKGGDLGWFAEGTMVRPFNDAAFSSKLGELEKVQTQFGFHIIEVTDRTSDKKKIQIATIQRTSQAGKETYADLFNKANSFSIDALDLESFNELVRERNLQRKLAVLSDGDITFPNEENSRDIVKWARGAKEGDVSEPFDLGNGFAVGIVESINEKGPAPLDKVINKVEFLARQDKKSEIFIEEMAGFPSIGELASKMSLSIENATNILFSSPAIPNVGIEPKVVGKALSLEKGQMSIPIQGSNGVFVISIDNKVVPSNANIVEIRDSERRGIAARIDNGAIFNALKEQTEVIDNRAKYY